MRKILSALLLSGIVSADPARVGILSVLIQRVKNVPGQADTPEGIFVSEPYYEWDQFWELSLSAN